MPHRMWEPDVSSGPPMDARSRLGQRSDRHADSVEDFNMKRALLTALMTGVAVVATVSVAAAQVPRRAEGDPDWSGVWGPGRDGPIAPLTNAPPARPTAPGPPAAPRQRPPSFAS